MGDDALYRQVYRERFGVEPSQTVPETLRQVAEGQEER